ncbi:unnamed protein product [Ostreobium quekettii]|uniref:Uncharacterized protein n=1 Tax=Ostreobium quekettii TaxID=121088 RepID=A0A8S1IKX4_9CHLO|nr:unnamed protein product [Ostreobium quekettii]
MADWEALCYFRQQRCAKEVVQLVAKSHGGQFNVDAQQFLLRHCICDSVCQVHPPSPAYLRRVLKYGIQKAEDQRMDLCEELLKQYLSCMSMATDATGGSWCFKSFSYGPALKVEEDDRVGTNLHIACSQPPDTDPKVGYRAHELITLRVSENMLEGATGCHPWEAGFLLGEFILNNPVLFSGRSILELGSGTGLVAVCLARVGARLAILTDGQQKAVENCRHNLNLNGIKHTAVDPSLLDFRKCVVSLMSSVGSG